MKMTNKVWIGTVGGVAGLAAMQLVHALSRPLVKNARPANSSRRAAWSLVGTHHQPGESATDALGRIAYQGVTGREPSPRPLRP
jgi:hypothetical protein